VTRGVVVAAAVIALAAGGASWWIASTWLAASALDTVTTDSIGDSVQIRARGQLPVFADRGDLPDLYRFASEQAQVLAFMPCTCGCGTFGHTSNRSCYVKAETRDQVTFTSHAAT
jgi:hypothetical protein